MLTLSLLPHVLGVCRLDAESAIPAWATQDAFFSITRTADELSIVCPAALIPAGVTAETGWRCLKVHGPLDFSLVGVLRSIAEPLAQAGISIFAISTYDTDYVLVQADALPRAIEALRRAGHRVNEAGARSEET
ncbi:ACT domain-containing protein [Ardenticatena maritima]|uniref:Amino acid-binding protein n=1 Tax=Ardenticatena maritima TaxID=872965 RepID=A0A0N8GS63_9CHLR|nr:ACT domain-containing protein [Ardenticatena maritima]KPL88418.1 amino acid-binding protein [Ardenticatena maritima]